MNKIWLITKREFTTRVKKKSFIAMSILGPLLFAGFFSTILFFAIPRETDLQKIAVIDNTQLFSSEIPNTRHLKFEFLRNKNIDSLKTNLEKTGYAGILNIQPEIAKGLQYYSYKNPSITTLNYISNKIEKFLRNEYFRKTNVENIDEIIKESERINVSIVTIKLTKGKKEKETNTDVARWTGYTSALIIYMFILLYGVQVMRGVMEEKTNRIVEVILSSVKPFQLMMGKILGVAMAAISQFVIWIILSTIFLNIAQGIFLPDMQSTLTASPQNIMENTQGISQMQLQAPQSNPEIAKIFHTINSINFFYIISAFIFYFIGGYLLYSSLFAAVGAAIDNESDSQQFVMPVMMPLILGVIVMIKAFMDPDSSIAYWFSIIPFTSPIVMMARIPYEIPFEQIAISMILLILTFITTTWMAAKIYRTGILMYGKKVTLKEMIKWLRYKQ